MIIPVYKAISFLALLSAAIASPIDKRQLATIQQNLGNVNTALLALDTAIKTANGPESTGPILQANNAVSTAITTATTQIQATQPLSLGDSLGLQNTGQQLATTAQTRHVGRGGRCIFKGPDRLVLPRHASKSGTAEFYHDSEVTAASKTDERTRRYVSYGLKPASTFTG